jgi:large subunit ribosomal protein L10
MGAAFAFGDPVKVAKLLMGFAKDTKVLHVRGAVLGGRYVDAAGVSTLSELPSREVLLSQVLGALQSPLAGLMNVLSGPMRGLAQVLKARSEQLEKVAAEEVGSQQPAVESV